MDITVLDPGTVGYQTFVGMVERARRDGLTIRLASSRGETFILKISEGMWTPPLGRKENDK